MGMITLSDEIERLVRRAVESGLAATPREFVEAAVLRMLEDDRAEQEEILRVAAQGIADIEAGRFETVGSEAEMEQLFGGIMERVRASRAMGG